MFWSVYYVSVLSSDKIKVLSWVRIRVRFADKRVCRTLIRYTVFVYKFSDFITFWHLKKSNALYYTKAESASLRTYVCDQRISTRKRSEIDKVVRTICNYIFIFQIEIFRSLFFFRSISLEEINSSVFVSLLFEFICAVAFFVSPFLIGCAFSNMALMRSKQSTSWKYGVDICKQLGISRPTQLLRTQFLLRVLL